MENLIICWKSIVQNKNYLRQTVNNYSPLKFFDGMHCSERQQGRIAGANPHKRQLPWGLGIDDGQQWNAREPGDESSQHLSRRLDVDGPELANAAVGHGNSR